MGLLSRLTIDLWSSLNHKAAMEPRSAIRLAPTWTGKEHQRRIAAYSILDAYRENCSREHLRTTSDAEKLSYREYGDPALLIARVVAGVVGESMTIEVDGADDDIPDTPEIPDPPDEPAEGDELAQRIYALRQERWQIQVDEAVDVWERAWRAQPALQAHQERLRQWADDELLEQKVWLGEEDATGLGDGVYVLGWDIEARRPILQVYDPRTYFPVLDDDASRRGYPSKVHLAWEERRDRPDGGEEVWLRRITYELVRDAAPRTYPWETGPSTLTCLLTDAEWRLTDANGDWVVDAVAPAKARYLTTPDGTEARDLDLRIDFIPVVHVPGVPSGREHYGRSVLARVLQLIDDLQLTDSAAQDAAALAGTPLIGASGGAAIDGDELVVRSGAVFKLGEGGRMDVLDMSGPLEALRALSDDLLERLSVNSQVPGALLGRVNPSDVPSGVALALSFSPFDQLVGVLRLVRGHKYRLLLKFAARLHQAAGVWDAGATPTARLRFGAFLPQDQEAVVRLVCDLLEARAISRETALAWLADIGFDITDIPGEIARLNAQDFVGAVQLLDATGDTQAVAEYLGRDIDPNARPEAPPEIELPQEDIG